MRGQRRTASVIPSVMLSVAAVLIMFIILGGIIQYYTSIANEPPLLPAYGTLYVLDADSRTGTVRIVNRFGYPVKALFSISVDSDRVAADMNITITPIVSFWVTIGPGEVTVNVYQYLERYLGVVKPEYVRWDESGFLIGNTFFPLQRGVGAPRPPGSPGSQTTNRQYTLTGIGTSHSVPRLVFATKYFDGSLLSVGFSHSLWFGYARSICGYQTPTVITTYRYGTRCRYSMCSLGGCAESVCVKYENNTCVRWDCFNIGSTDYSCDSTETPYHDYSSYPCGLDGSVCTYWTPSIARTASVGITTLSLRGMVNDPGGLAVDRKSFSLSPTSASTRWEYILPQDQQSQCEYTYREIRYSTTLTYGRECCTQCSGSSICATAVYCSESSTVTYIEKRHACQYALGGSWWCAGLSTFLVGELTSGDVIVEVRQAVDGIAVRFNMTLNYRYTRYYDPELSDSYMRIMPVYIFTLTLPPIRGYFSIPYNEDLKSAIASVSMSVSRMVATVRTGSGYEDTRPLIEAETVGWSSPVSTTPVGYVALPPSGSVEGAKTFYFTTTSSPVVYLTVLRTVSPYVTVPMCSLSCNDFGCSCSDTVTINLIVDVLLGVGVTINTTTS